MSCNQFTAPNGEPSILFPALEQKLGADEATRLWNWAHSPSFDAFFHSAPRDKNGEPTAEYIREIIDRAKKAKSTPENLPDAFLQGIVLEDSNPLKFDEREKKKAMDQLFVQVRDNEGRATGQYWNSEKQSAVIDSVLYMLYNSVQLHPDWNVEDHRNDIKRKLGTATGDLTTERGKNYQAVINSFYHGEKKNDFWNFSMRKLDSLGIRITKKLREDTTDLTDEGKKAITNESGTGLRDFYDSSFEVDIKDTASTRMKMFILSTVKSHFEDETQPREIKLPFSNPETRVQLKSGVKSDSIRSAEEMKRLGITAAGTLPANMPVPARKQKTEVTARIEDKLMRVSAVKTMSEEELNQPASWNDSTGKVYNGTLRDRIKSEEGYEPKAGDTLLRMTPYEQQKNILVADKNYLNLPELVDYEDLFSRMTGVLSGITPDYDKYIKAMQDSGDANIQRVVEKLQTAEQSVKNEFTSVMSTQYQQQEMILFRRSKDGTIEPRVISSNRAGELETVQNFWKESQKNSAILTKDASGNTTINKPLAAELHAELMSLQGKNYNKERAVALLKRTLESNGIVMHEKALEDFIERTEKVTRKPARFYSGDFAHQFAINQKGDPMGIVSAIISGLHTGEDANEADREENYQVGNPLYTKGTSMQLLARLEARYAPKLFTQTHRSVEGKNIYSYGFNTALSHAMRDLTQSEAFRKRYEESPFAKGSWLLSSIGSRPNFQLAYLDGLKNEYSQREGVTRPDMSDREQWLSALALFQNGHYLGLTHSDKTTTPVFLNGPKLYDVYENRDGDLRLSKNVVTEIYRSVFMGEYNRILQHAGRSFNVKGYDEGKKHFFLLPKFNEAEMEKLVKAGVITEGDKNAIWKNGTLVNQTGGMFEVAARKVIIHQLKEMISQTKKSWKDSGLLDAGVPGSNTYITRLLRNIGLTGAAEGEGQSDGRPSRKQIPFSKMAWTMPDGTILKPGESKEHLDTINNIATSLLAADYTANSFLFNTSLSQLFYGDPALFWKKSVNGTLIEYGKRLAKDIAPGRDGAWKHSPQYTTVTAADYQPLVKELKGVPGYADPVEGSDAQEVTTVQEHLDVLYAYGKITDKQYQAATGRIRDARGGYYDFKDDPELHDLILQPTKPVAVGMRDAVDGLMSIDYVKSSGYPLYPPITTGRELDKLRRAMEDEKTGVQRLNFLSAKKTGAPAKSVEIFSKDGTINEAVFKGDAWNQTSRQVLDRSEFRLQQEVPYDEDKTHITTVTQMNWNIVHKLPTIKTPFKFDGNEYSGEQMRKMKEDIRSQIIRHQHEDFLDSIGAHYDPKQDAVIFKDRKKLYQQLVQEVKNRKGYTLNDVAAIQSYWQGDTLTVPLMFTPSASRFEGKLMSMVSDIIKVKMPGKSYIQAAPAGFKAHRNFESLVPAERSKIIWTTQVQDELKTAHLSEDGSTVHPAQVLVSANFFRRHGINIEDYVNPETGLVDTERVPRELFQMIGARIPNAGHSSMLPIEIAGFLPDEMGDMVVVPAAITKQMGADFDVDKLFSYNRTFKKDGDKLAVLDAQVENREDELNYLKNQYVDLHWSVLTNPEIFPDMMSPLDMPDLAEQAELLNEKTGVPYYFSPSYQVADFRSMQGAKALVGMTALSIDSNVKFENKAITIGERVAVETKEGIDFVEQAKPIMVLDEEGQPLPLTHLSGYGESTYIDKDGNKHKRTKADNLKIQENEAVDHAKNRTIDKLNLDASTYPASAALSRLQTIDGKAVDLRYNTGLLMQPIIREFALEMLKQTDSMSTGFTANAQDAVFKKLYDKYADTPSGGDLDEAFTNVYDLHVNPKRLLEMMKSPDKGEQLAALKLFRSLDSIGRQLMTIQSLTKQDTRGAGDSMLSVLSTEEKRGKLNSVDSEYQILGSDQLFKGEVGITYDSTIPTAMSAYEEDLPYRKAKPLYDSIAQQTGRQDLSDDMKKTVFNGLKSYAFSHPKLGMWQDGYAERMRLIYPKGDSKSLAQRVLEAKKTWGKKNYFLQRLETNMDPDHIRPDYVTYTASKVTNLDDFENNRAWLDMLSSGDPEQKKLGEDLIRYSFLTGGIQGANNFVKYIPFAYMAGTEISASLREFHSKIDSFATNNSFREQWFQHYPQYARQLSPDLKETGASRESAPDTFHLPALVVDRLSENPAKDLSIRIADETGKKFLQYPVYLSYREGNKWLLYKKMFLHGDFNPNGVMYGKIDTLGDKNMDEFTIANGTVRSAIPANRSPWFDHVEPERLKLSNNNEDYIRTTAGQERVLRQVGLFKPEGDYSDIVNSLHVISADKEQPSHLRVMASALAEMDRHPVENELVQTVLRLNDSFRYRVNSQMRQAAAFDSVGNQMHIGQASMRSKERTAESILHELLHYHTTWLVAAGSDEAGLRDMKFNEPTLNAIRMLRKVLESTHPEILEKVKALDEVRKQAFNELERAIIKRDGQQGWEDRLMRRSQGQPLQDNWDKLMYGLGTPNEFITHIFTSPEVMDFLNGVKYEGKKTLLETIKDVMSGMWSTFLKAMGVKADSLLEESIKRGMDVMTYRGSAEGFYRSLTPDDMSSMHMDMHNETVATSALDSIDKVLGKMQEQIGELRGSYTGIISPKERADKHRKIEAIEEDMEWLKKERDFRVVNEIGKKQLKWVNTTLGTPDASANQLMTAHRIAEMWDGMIKLLYGEGAESIDPDLSQVVTEAQNNIHKLIHREQGYLTDMSKGVITERDWMTEALKDVSEIQGRARSLHSAASSQVLQYISGYVENVGRQRDEDAYRLMKELNQLEKDMHGHFGSNEALQLAYKKFIRDPAGEDDKTFQMTQQYSAAWFKHRADLTARRNGILKAINDRYKDDENGPMAKSDRRKAWKQYWDEVTKTSAFVDTRKFFNPETGEFKDGIEQHVADLESKVGKDHAKDLMARAHERYLRYLEDKRTMTELLEAEVTAGEKTEEDAKREQQAFMERNSPNFFFDTFGGKKGFRDTSDRYIAVAPLASRSEFWDEKYKGIMADEKQSEFYHRYKGIMARLLSNLPKTIQDRGGSGFLPYVDRSLVSHGLDLPAYFKNMSKRFIHSVTATGWEEQMNERSFSKIPIEYTNPKDVDPESRSTDLVRIAEIFGMMSLHYKHFSAAKDVIDMGEAVLKEIDRTRSAGSAQIEQNGRYVTATKGLRNALDALKFLKDYSVYRKPKQLEFESGFKMYTEKTEDGKKYSINPAKQIAISNKVTKLIAEKKALEEKYIQQFSEEGAEPMSKEDYDTQLEKIDKELNKYDGMKLFGSKIGDKLISINQLKTLSYNPFSAVANMGFGVVSVFIHSQGQRDFTFKEAAAALSLMKNSIGRWASFGTVHSDTAEKIKNIMERMGVMGDFVDSMYGKKVENRDSMPKWKKTLNPFEMMRSGDFFMKGLTTTAVLLHQKVEVEENGEKKQISVFDALGKDGKWNEEKYGKRPEWHSDDVKEQAEWDKLRNRVLAVNMVLHGNQDKNSPKMLNKNVLGRLIGQFRLSWLPEGWYNRFQSERYDQYLERTVKGRYRTAADLGLGGTLHVLSHQLMNLIPGVKTDPFTGLPNGKVMTETDIENMRRNFAELGFWTMMTATILTLKHMNNNDDSSDDSKALQLLINQLIRGRQDIEFYASPQVFDSITRDIIPATNVLKDYGNAIKASGRYIIDDNYEFNEWLLKITKAGLPIPQSTLVNKTNTMLNRDIDTYSR
jgi:hypothetical protein